MRDQAMALEHYARLANNIEAEHKACKIRLRAEHRGGELLKEMALSGERETGGKPSSDTRVTLSDLGISYDQSAHWQKLADVPDDMFEQALAADNYELANLIRIEAANRDNPVKDKKKATIAR